MESLICHGQNPQGKMWSGDGCYYLSDAGDWVLAPISGSTTTTTTTITITQDQQPSDVIGLEGIWIGLDWIVYGWSGFGASDIWIGLDRFVLSSWSSKSLTRLGKDLSLIRRFVTQNIQ